MKKTPVFALIGNPNSGKTTLFNSLTGSTARVGNWAGVTVEKKEGIYKNSSSKINVIDLPGIYSLSPYTAEEIVSRNYILDNKPDCVINVVDATNLERNLYLTTQLMEIDVPVVIALNMSDIVRKRGDSINIELLEKATGFKVVEISALKEENLDDLMNNALEESFKHKPPRTVIKEKELLHLLDDVCTAFKAMNVENPLYHAIKFIELDELEVKAHPDLIGMVEAFKESHKDEIFGDDYEALIADARYKTIESEYACALKKNTHRPEIESLDPKSNKIDKVLTHKIFAIPILILIMFLIFHITFSNDFLFLKGIWGVKITDPITINFFTGMGYSSGTKAIEGIPSLGIFLQNWMNYCTNFIISSIRNAMPLNAWYTSLICDGLLGGIAAVFAFIPLILLLFFFIAVLEDSGYMSRIAFILDRVFRKIGLSGKAFIPMLTGFGCSVPAIMATRTLEDYKEKNRTIRLMTCFSCGAKAPIWALLAGVGMYAGFPGDFFVFSIYLIGIAAAVVFAIFMKLFSKDKYNSPFIMELPSYHLPQFKNVAARVWEKLKDYLIKAATVIAASSIVIWFLKSFGIKNGTFMFLQEIVEGELVLNVDHSLLSYIGRGINYVFYPLGWAMDCNGWKYTVSMLTGFIAKEDVVVTLSQLGLGNNAAGLSAISTLSVEGVYSFALFNLFTLPCFATIAATRSEQKRKEFWKTILWWLCMSYGVSFITYWLMKGCRVLPVIGYTSLALLIILVIAFGVVLYRRFDHKLWRNK